MKVKIWKGDMTLALAERRCRGGGGLEFFLKILEWVRCVSPQGTK